MPYEKIPGYPSLKKHPNGTYYYVGSIPGLGEKRVSTGSQNLKEAAKAAREIERELLKLKPNSQPQTYGEIAEEAFKVRMQKNRGTTSYQARLLYDQLIAGFGANLPIERATDSRWLELADGWTRKTKRRTLANLRKYAVQIDNYAFKKGYKAFRCDFPINDPKKREGKVLTDVEFALAVEGCVTRRRRQRNLPLPLVRRFIEISRRTTMTYESICRLRWDEIAAGDTVEGLLAGVPRDGEWVFPAKKGDFWALGTVRRTLWEMGYRNELADAEVEALFARAEKESEERVPLVGEHLAEGKSLRLFLVMARTMGMRRSEVTQLKRERIDLVTRSITLTADETKTGSKTGRGRQFGISPEAWPLLLDALETAKSPWLFPNLMGAGPVGRQVINRRVNRLCRDIGVHFRPHDLRHTFLTQKLLVEKKNPMDVAIYAGVSLQVIQDVYLHPKVDDTRHVVEAAAAAVVPPPAAPALSVVRGGVT